MKRQMTAIFIGTILAVTGFTLPRAATATAQESNSALSSFSAPATGDLEGETSSSEQRCSTQLLKDAQTLCVFRRRGRSTRG